MAVRFLAMKITEKVKSVNALVPGAITGILEKIQRDIKLSEEDRLDLRLILEEALTNGAKHGNKFDVELYVTVDVVFDQGTFVITVADEGKGFDPAKVPDPRSSQELKHHGRGIYLMKKIADDVRFNEQGNVITIVKKIAKTA